MADCERKNYKDYVVAPHSFELRDGGFSLEVTIEKHSHAGVHLKKFVTKETYKSEDAACEAGYQFGAQIIDGDIPGLDF
jgi:hypothetical protein